MQNIIVGRYEQPTAGYVGWIEPADKGWIAFIDTDGRPRFFLHRDEKGGVLPDDPAERAEALRLRA